MDGQFTKPRDRDWLVPVTLVCAVQLALWSVSFLAGNDDPPFLTPYLQIASLAFVFAGACRIFWIVCAMARAAEPNPLQRTLESLRSNIPRILAAIVGAELFAVASAAFIALKSALPSTVGFYFDPALASAEASVFGAHPWQVTHAILGWATPLIDRIYFTFIPVHLVALYSVLLSRPSARKSQALVSLALAWPILAVGCAYAMSSAGPIFYDRVYGGGTFADLNAVLQSSAPLTFKIGEGLWAVSANNSNILVNGISAMPSMHVALTLWLVLLVRGSRFAPLAWAYFFLICLGSVHLGWHYVSDGLFGVGGMLFIWNLAPQLIGRIAPTVQPPLAA